MYRHGEVFLQRVDAMPETTKAAKSYIVGHSETGHHHLLQADTEFEVAIDKDDLYIRLFEPGKLVHQKTVNRHNDIDVKPGIYKIINKREYNPFTKIMERVWD